MGEDICTHMGPILFKGDESDFPRDARLRFSFKREPLILLERIKQLMHTPEKAKYPALTTVEILSNFLRCKQGKKESLLDYLSRFKSERDVVYRILGKNVS